MSVKLVYNPFTNNFDYEGAGGGGGGGIMTVNGILPDGGGNFTISAGSDITITPETNGIQIAASAAPPATTTYDGDTGSAVPSSDILKIAGGTGISTSASGNTVTINSSATDSSIHTINTISPDSGHNFSIDAGSNITITPGTNSISIAATIPPSTGVLTLSGNNSTEATPDNSGNILIQGVGSLATSVTGLAPHTMNVSLSGLTSNSVLSVSSANNTLTSNLLTNGQLLIGSTSAPPVAATLTAGSGIAIANASGSITISATATASGIQTINSIAPNGSGEFGITAGSGITITPGTNAISIAATAGSGGFSSINEYLFTTNGMYVPSAGASTILVEIVGGGGGGGNVSGATNYGAGGGGGGGEWASGGYFASMQPIVIGQGGAGGSAGTPTSFGGSLLSANGGQPGTTAMTNVPANGGAGGGGGSGSSFRVQGGSGGTGFGVSTISPAFMLSGKGGDSKLGFGAQGYAASGSSGVYNGNLGQKFGGGGSGGIIFGTSGSSAIGGTGASGAVYIIEYCT